MVKRVVSIGVSIIFLLSCTIELFAQADWVNWGNTVHCRPRTIKYPSTLQEVQAIINDAISNNIKIKPIGSGHSWSDLMATDGYLVNTDNLCDVIWLDLEKSQIKVQAGIKLKHLIRILADYGLALSNQGFISEQSIAGAIATATHGTGKAYNVSDYVIGIELIDGTGVLHEINQNSHPDWLPYARVALGALGFIYSVTLQCEPLFKLKHKRVLIDRDILIKEYSALYDEHDFYMFMIHPHSQDALLFTWNRTDEEVNTEYFHYMLNDCVFNKFLNCMTLEVLKILPLTANRSSLDVGFKALEMNEHVDYSYISLSPMKAAIGTAWYIEEELAVPFELFPFAIKELDQLYHQYDPNHELLSLITCRFGPASHGSPLSPCYGRKTAYITINIMSPFDRYDDFFKEFEERLFVYGGRPHWGKYHHLEYSKIKELYNPQHVCCFNDLRKILDPHSLFANDFLNRCFSVSD